MRDDPTIADLVFRARSGDQSAWDGLVERFAPLLWSICRRYRLSGPDADDVGQSVWLRLLEHLPAIREPAALAGWLVTTTTRECLCTVRVSGSRDRKEIVVDHDSSVFGRPALAEESLIVEERNAAVRAAFAQLSLPCRQLLALLVHDPPFSYAEIGDTLGIPVGGIGPTRARCLKKLRRSAPLVALIETDPPIVRGGGEHERPMVER
jgi:RNA polymerase sigma factor (sigma-70 family)